MLVFLAQFQTTRGTSSTATPIQHIIIVMQENHSFDNYFGTYPTANGTLLDPITFQLQHVNGIPDRQCLPYQGSCISPLLTTSPDPSNPIEGQSTYEMDYSNNGTGFPAYSGPQSMVYFDYHSLAAYWDYAQEYGLGDNYFASALTTTTPNRLMILAGDTPVAANYGPPPYIPYSETVMRQLDDAGVSWGYYDYIDAYGGTSNVYPLNYSSDMPQNAFRDTRNISNLIQELANGSGLPSVSFVNSLGNPELTEHPPFNPTVGELWVVSIINQVMKSSYWPTTAIFVTWDEGGGYYDHVMPPNEFTIDHSFTQPLVGLGQRVPLLVISPYARENFVSHDLLSHLSLLHFIEYNWILPPLNGLVAGSTLPLGFFNFSQPPRSPVILNSPMEYPILVESRFSVLLPAYLTEFGFVLVALAIPLALALRRRKSSSQTPIDSNGGENDDERYDGKQNGVAGRQRASLRHQVE
jgi:phospholipase C